MTDTPGDEQSPPQDAAAAPPPPAPPGYGTAPPPPPGGAGAPPPPPPRGARRLTRKSHGGMIFGVAAGLGEYFDLDPIIVRVAFVLLTITGGAGVVLYILAALLMPGDGGEPAAVHEVMRRMDHARRHRWLGIVLIIVAVALLLSNLHSVDGTVFWGLGLIAIGVLLFQQEGMGWDRRTPFASVLHDTSGGRAAPPDAPVHAAAPAPASTGWAPPDPERPAPPPAWQPSAAWGRPPPPPTPRAHRQRPPIGWITLALSLVAVGVAVLLANAGVISLSVGAALAVVLTVIGAGLVVSAFTGRSWGLIVLGVLLVPVVGTASVVDEPLSGGVGDRIEAPQSAADVHRDYDLGVGQLTIDLTQAHLGSAPMRVHASVAFGRLVVLVPADLPVVVHGHAGAGSVDLIDRRVSGVRVSEDASEPGTSNENALTLDLGVGLGQVRVERPAASPAPL